MLITTEITEIQKQYILNDLFLELLIKHNDKTRDELHRLFDIVMDEYFIYEKFKKECPKMKPHPKITYYDDYQTELDKLDKYSKQPKTISIRTIVKTEFYRWFKNTDTPNYNGKTIPFSTFSNLLNKDKDYLIENNKIINLDYQWTDCKYK